MPANEVRQAGRGHESVVLVGWQSTLRMIHYYLFLILNIPHVPHEEVLVLLKNLKQKYIHSTTITHYY